MGGSYFLLAAKWFLSGSLSGEESWLPTVSPSGGRRGQGRACLWLQHCDKQQMMRRARSSRRSLDKDLLWNPSTRPGCKDGAVIFPSLSHFQHVYSKTFETEAQVLFTFTKLDFHHHPALQTTSAVDNAALPQFHLFKTVHSLIIVFA